jgi:hypothetical protein
MAAVGDDMENIRSKLVWTYEVYSAWLGLKGTIKGIYCNGISNNNILKLFIEILRRSLNSHRLQRN